MRLVAGFLRLDATERRLVIRCASVLVAMQCGLWILTVRRLHALITGAARRWRASSAARRHSPERIAWAVRAAARFLPGATCLPQALAVQYMLGRAGHPGTLRIGFAVSKGHELAGHAWVECDGAIVLHGSDRTRYVPLPGLGPQRDAKRGVAV
jgi:hypothetical protein